MVASVQSVNVDNVKRLAEGVRIGDGFDIEKILRRRFSMLLMTARWLFLSERRSVTNTFVNLLSSLHPESRCSSSTLLTAMI